jgi:hypothetical protein
MDDVWQFAGPHFYTLVEAWSADFFATLPIGTFGAGFSQPTRQRGLHVTSTLSLSHLQDSIFLKCFA